MAVSSEHIAEKLKEALDAIHVDVEDLSGGCGAKFFANIVSTKFQGVPLLQRHRLVNSILEEELQSIHAFQMKTLTPEQWEKLKETKE